MKTGAISNVHRLGLVALLVTGAANLWGDEPNLPTAAESMAMIHLTDGSSCRGALAETQSGKHLGWQGADFTSPFAFAIDAVSAVHFPIPEKPPQPNGEFCFELNGGDLLFGSLRSLDRNEMVIDAAEFGQLHVDRRIVRRMFRWARGDMIYLGPDGLHGWQKATLRSAAFRAEGGQLVANQNGAAIRRDFGAPPQACFEFELSWAKRADFDLAVGVGADVRSVQRAFHFEVWDGRLIVRRATEREADVAELQQIKPGPGRAHFTAFLDQQKGRIIVYSSAEKLADITVDTANPQAHGGIQLVNHSGDVRLERLRISRWNGNAPQPTDGEKARIHGPDGAVVYGGLKSYDPGRAELVIAAVAGEQRVPIAQALDVVLSGPQQATPGSLRTAHLSGVRISGELAKVDDQGIWLKRPGIREPIVSPVAALAALTFLNDRVRSPQSSRRLGRLELQTARLSGWLVDGEEGDQSCLVWQPAFSSTASPLVRGVSAKILYRTPPPPTPVVRSNRLLTTTTVRRPLSALETETKVMAQSRRASRSQAVLHLRAGDTFVCTVTGVDEKGVTFRSAVVDATLIPHDQIKVLELMPEVTPVAIAKVKKDRLLTLPRMQRDNPPTQLIRAVNGDYLRGRLVSMDEKELRVEVRLDTQTVPRQNVARIIWLHPEELDPDASPANKPQRATRVQALPADGNRMTFFVNKVEGSILSGRSDALGNCRVGLNDIDQLLVGATIEESASTLAFHQWRLIPALEPLPDPEGEGGGEGFESVLVRTPAPDFELDLLTGGNFRLSRERGSIVVLDFWASWCGPCIQTMPQVESVAQEFAGVGVKLVSVNQQETPERIREVLERLKLKASVALDREGLIGEKYGAITIPLTVIVDREGNVARVFNEGGATFAERFRAALQQVVDGAENSE